MNTFLKFFFSGILTYGINIGLTYFLKEVILLSSEISYFIALSCITVINFLISLHFTFKKKYRNNILIKYFFFLLTFAGLNYIATIALKNTFGDEFLYIIIFLVTGILFFGKFIVYNKIVFTKLMK